MEGEYVLIFKQRGKKTEIKITKKVKMQYSPNNFTAVVNFRDYKNLALFFDDMEVLWNFPIQKAIKEYQKNKEEKDWAF